MCAKEVLLCNLGRSYEKTPFTVIDLESLEEGFKKVKKFFDSM